jgi:hypothetical protein
MTIPLPPKPPAPPAHYTPLTSPPTRPPNAPASHPKGFIQEPEKTLPLVAKDSLTTPDIVQQIIASTLTPLHATDPKVLLFIANYNLTKDVKQAARQSGLHANDGKHLINRKDIYDCIQKIAQAGSRKFGYDAEEVVAKVKEVIEFDPIDLIDPSNGTFFEDISQIPAEARRVIKKLTVQNVYDKDPNGVIIGLHSKILKFEFWDKLKAAEMLGGEKDIFKRQVKVEHDVGTNMRETLLGRLEDADSRKALKAKDVTTHE